MNFFDLLGRGVGATALDVDNALYMTAMSQAVPEKDRKRLIFWGILLEYGARLVLLAISLYVFSGDETLFTMFGVDITPAGLAMILAGIFLIVSNLGELGSFLAGKEEKQEVKEMPFGKALTEMTVVNTALSIDTVVAVADMSDNFLGMAVILSVSSIIRLLFVQQIARFLTKYPSTKILTSSLLIIIGTTLVLQAFNDQLSDIEVGIAFGVAILLMVYYDKYGPKFWKRESEKQVPERVG